MAYTDVPLAPDRIKNTQPTIRQNFVEITDLIDVDHYTFGSPTIGDHKKVTFQDQGLTPAFAGNEIGVFSKIPTGAPLTTINELFMRKQNADLTVSETPFTASNKALNGWTYLPSGLLIKWGTETVTGFDQPVIYPDDNNMAIPRFGNVFHVSVSMGAFGLYPTTVCNVVNASQTLLQFRANVFLSNTGGVINGRLNYIAIGTGV